MHAPCGKCGAAPAHLRPAPPARWAPLPHAWPRPIIRLRTRTHFQRANYRLALAPKPRSTSSLLVAPCGSQAPPIDPHSRLAPAQALAPMQEACGGPAAPPPSAAPPLPAQAPAAKPFLRRGAGWEGRMAAAREGRKYVPRGGPIKDYSKEDEVPRRLGSKPRPARQPHAAKTAAPAAASSGPRASARKATRGNYSSQAAASGKPTRSGAPSAAASPRRQHPAAPARALPSPAACPPAAAPASTDWARRLLQRPCGAAGELAAPNAVREPQQVEQVRRCCGCLRPCPSTHMLLPFRASPCLHPEAFRTYP